MSQVCAGSRINMVILNFCSWLGVSPASPPVWVDMVDSASLNRVSQAGGKEEGGEWYTPVLCSPLQHDACFLTYFFIL